MLICAMSCRVLLSWKSQNVSDALTPYHPHFWNRFVNMATTSSHWSESLFSTNSYLSFRFLSLHWRCRRPSPDKTYAAVIINSQHPSQILIFAFSLKPFVIEPFLFSYPFLSTLSPCVRNSLSSSCQTCSQGHHDIFELMPLSSPLLLEPLQFGLLDSKPFLSL